MICSRTDWAAFGVAPATSALNIAPAGMRRGAAKPQRLDARGPTGGFAPTATLAAAR